MLGAAEIFRFDFCFFFAKFTRQLRTMLIVFFLSRFLCVFYCTSHRRCFCLLGAVELSTTTVNLNSVLCDFVV